MPGAEGLQTKPRLRQELEAEDGDGEGHASPLTSRKNNKSLPRQWQYFIHLQVPVLSILFQQGGFQPHLPADITAGMKTETSLPYS